MLNFHRLISKLLIKKTLILFAVFGFAIVSGSALAQDESESTDNAQETSPVSSSKPSTPELIVSASRVPVPAEHIGSSVTVLTAEEIEKRKTDYVHELLREIPSVGVSQSGAHGGNAQIRIRGAEANHTLVIIDGLEMGNPFSGDEFQLQHLPSASFRSIEVLRGPQSSIHGSESIGGVINFTTAIPEQGTESSVSAEMGTLKSRKVNAYIGTATDGYFATITASHNETEGVSSRTHNEEPDGHKNQFLHLKTGLQAGENIDLSATLIGIKSSSEYDGFGSNDYLGKDKKLLFGTTLKFNEEDDAVFHKFSLSKSQHDRKDFRDGGQTSSSRGEQTKFVYQSTLNYETERAIHSTTFAAEQKNKKVRSASLSHPAGGALKLRSYILEQRLNFDETKFLSASARYDDDRSNQFSSKSTYRLSGAWILDDRFRVHSSYGTGVKNPTVQDIYGWTGSWLPNPSIEPETGKGWDLGVEAQLGDGSITVDATFFYNKIDNLINIYACVENCDDGDFSTNIYRSQNVPGESRIRGLELSARGELGAGHEVSAHWTHSDGIDANKRNLVRRPTRTASLNVNKDLPLFGRPANVNFNIQHTGLQFDWDYSKLPGFTIANLAASVEISPNSEITARIKNLFNKTDYAEVGGYGVAKRSFHLGIRYSF